ncbi:DUF6284 family protein [Actinoplanes sp. NPDC051494]|uniref:DUF6284 family protein n=1 Tax=Actinoplanes sp. NPDC051494 TaxID=3363907 RepID=UPI0037903A6F
MQEKASFCVPGNGRTDREPTPEGLVTIEAVWPLIEADMDVLDAEIALINAADNGGPTEIDWRRLRRAEARALAVAVELAAPRSTALKAVA